MITSQEDAANGVERRARMESLLSRYPDLSADQLRELVAWFSKEASALDVGLIASNERVSTAYARFRAEHIDRFGPKDVVHAVLFTAAVLGVVLLIAMGGS